MMSEIELAAVEQIEHARALSMAHDAEEPTTEELQAWRAAVALARLAHEGIPARMIGALN